MCYMSNEITQGFIYLTDPFEMTSWIGWKVHM